MTMSELLTNIKMSLGIYVLKLPFDNADEMLVNVIKQKTLRSFSNLYPTRRRVPIDADDLELIYENIHESKYKLPSDYFGKMKISNIYSVTPINSFYADNFRSSSLLMDQGYDLFQDVMLAQVGFDLASTIAPPFTFKFEYPNMLTLYNMTTCYNKLLIEIGFQHPDNLSTIKPTMEDSFIQLATLDVKSFLYNNLKYYDGLETAYARLNLLIDNWSNAEQEAQEFRDRMAEDMNLDVVEQVQVI